MAAEKKSRKQKKNFLKKPIKKVNLKSGSLDCKINSKPFFKCPLNEKINCKNASCVNYENLNDNQLVSAVHNKEAYDELFLRYQKKLFSYIFHLVRNKDEAEDILQNVFSKMYKNISDFDISRKFSSWAYRIAHNEAINFLKRKNKRYTVSWEDINSSKDKLDTASNDEMPEEKWEHLEIVRGIDKSLEKLPEKYKQVLELRYFQEYSYEEIGHILKKPINTIGTLINRAKRKLLDIVKQEGL